MKNLIGPSLLFALLTSLSVGCVDEAGPGTGKPEPIASCTGGDFERPDLELVEVGVSMTPAPDGPAFQPVELGVAADGSACDCADDACVVDWIADNMGCGVCMRMTCGDETVGGCLPCAPLPDASLGDDGGDDSPCVIGQAEINAPDADLGISSQPR